MNRTIFGTTAAFAAICAVGCGSGSGSYTPKPTKPVTVEQVSNEDGKLLFPAKVGNRWTYDIESHQSIGGQVRNSNDTLVFEITAIQPSGTGNKITISSTVNGEKANSQVWLFDDRGLFQLNVSTTGTTYDPPQPTFVFPIKPGENFNWKGVGPSVTGEVGRQTYKGTMYQPQIVDTKMGSMTGVGIEANGEFTTPKAKNGRVKVVSYWTKNVGLVRYRQDSAYTADNGVVVAGSTLLILKDYKLKQD